MTPSHQRPAVLVLIAAFAAAGCIDTSLNVTTKTKDTRVDTRVIDNVADVAPADMSLDADMVPDLPGPEDTSDAEALLHDVVDAADAAKDAPEVGDAEVGDAEDVGDVEISFEDTLDLGEAGPDIDCDALCEGIECGYAGECLCNSCAPLPNSETTQCKDGECQVVTCADDWGHCDDDHANGCETDTVVNMLHCGKCENPCLDGQVCSQSTCNEDCLGGLTKCPEIGCADIKSDPAHCGGCGEVCEYDHGIAACVQSNCLMTGCEDGWVNVDDDPADGCEYECTVSNEGLDICDGKDNDCNGETDEFFDLMTDVNNCGTCENLCEHETVVAWKCVAGNCIVVECQEGFKNANGLAKDGCEIPWFPGGELWVDTEKGGTWPEYDGSQGKPFATIHEAVAVAFEGYLIHVLEGEYFGGVLVSTPGLTIKGDGPDKVTVSTSDEDTGFLVTADGVTIEGMAITGGQFGVHFQGTMEKGVLGGQATLLAISQLATPEGSNEPAAGVFVGLAEGVVVSLVDVFDIVGAKGQLKGGAGGPGQVAAGFYLDEATGCTLSANTVSTVVGGVGGNGAGEGSGGTGGIGAGVYLSASSSNVVSGSSFDTISGGIGGTGGQSGPGGAAQAGFGVYLSADALNNKIDLSNTMAQEAIAYVYGGQGVVFEDLVLTVPVNPTNWGKIAVIDSSDVVVSSNIISGFVGATGATSTEGSVGAGIRFENCDACQATDNVIGNVEGGHGGTGSYKGTGGTGGFGAGLYVADSTACILVDNAVEYILGGTAGNGGKDGGIGGTGGTGNAVRVSGSVDCVVSGNQVVSVDGGTGGKSAGGPPPGSGGAGVAFDLVDSDGLAFSGNMAAQVKGGSNVSGTPSLASCVRLSNQPATTVSGLSCYGIGLEGDGAGQGISVAAGQEAPLHIVDSIISNVSDNCLWNHNDNAAELLYAAYTDLHACGDGPSHNASAAFTCISKDPLFVDPENGDFHLQAESPCIDAGDPDSDYDNEPNPNGCRVNLGAYGNTDEAASALGAEHCIPGCEPACDGKECGDNGCGGSCGECGENEKCDGNGQCVCANVGCEGTCCVPGEICFEQACCLADCTGRECGTDGCGGTCGECNGVQEECVNGTCACQPACDGMECDPDGCGEVCGVCGPGLVCQAGVCTNQCGLGLDNCDGSCVDFTSDPAYCGNCETECATADPAKLGTCSNSQCGGEDCPDGAWNLDGKPGNGCEYVCAPAGVETCNNLDDDCNGEVDEAFDLKTDLTNCGECGQVCQHDSVAEYVCAQGLCLVKKCEDGNKDANGLGDDGCETAWVPTGELWVDAWDGGSWPDYDGSEAKPFGTIQEAVDASFEGFLIHVLEGAYWGGVVVDVPGVTIRGVGKDSTFVAGPTYGTGFLITADGVTIEALSIGGVRVGVRYQGEPDMGLQGGRGLNLLISQIDAEQGSGEPAAGIVLENAREVSLTLLSVVDVHGGSGDDVSTPGMPGGIGAGVMALESEDCWVAGTYLSGTTGGTGGQGKPSMGPCNGNGGAAMGVFLSQCTGFQIHNNHISSMTGGAGGSGGSYASGGTGGIAAGIFLVGSTASVMSENTISLVSGGEGGISSYSGIGQEGFGIYLMPDSLDNLVGLSNSVDGESVVYLYGAQSAVIQGLTLTGETNPTNWGKIAVFDSADVQVLDNVVSGFRGESGSVWGCGGADGHGKEGVGVRVDGCTLCIVQGNIVSVIGGGAGGRGGYYHDGGDAEFAAGIMLAGCLNCAASGNTVSLVEGGKGGAGAYNGDGGTGGDGIGILVMGTSFAALSANVVSESQGGEGGIGKSGNKSATGGTGGSGLGVHVMETSACTLSGTVVSSMESGAGGAGKYPGATGRAACVRANGSPQLLLRRMTCHDVASDEAGNAYGIWMDEPAAGPVQVLDSIVSGTTGYCLYNSDKNAMLVLSASYSDLFDCGLAQASNASVAGTCISADPLFVDAENGDFHLQAESPCIDAGKATSECSGEPAPNGCQVNMGAYGNTAEAASKAGADHCDACPP